MKKTVSIMLLFLLLCGTLIGCGQQETSLVSKKTLPDFLATDMDGNPVDNTIFEQYDATIVNFWYTGCGSCVAEMPDLEELSHTYAQRNIGLIGICTDACNSEKDLEFAKKILAEKGVTYPNLVPDPESEFYKDFVAEIFSYPSSFVVDSEGNLIGASFYDVPNQLPLLEERLEMAMNGTAE